MYTMCEDRSERSTSRVLLEEKKRRKCELTMARFIAHVQYILYYITYTLNVPHFYPETDKSKSYCALSCGTKSIFDIVYIIL